MDIQLNVPMPNKAALERLADTLQKQGLPVKKCGIKQEGEVSQSSLGSGWATPLILPPLLRAIAITISYLNVQNKKRSSVCLH